MKYEVRLASSYLFARAHSGVSAQLRILWSKVRFMINGADRIHGDDRQLDVAAVAFHHDDGHFLAVDRRLQHLAGVYVLAGHNVFATTGGRHLFKGRLLARIGRLITGRSIRSVVDDHQDIVVGHVVVDGRQRAEIGQNRPVAINGNHRLVLRQRKTKTDGRGQTHRAQHVEIRRLIVDHVQLLAGQTDVTINQLIPQDRCNVFQDFRTDLWSP